MLTESEYLDIAERYQRASMGDGSVMPQLLQVDIAHLLTDWREWERIVRELEEINRRQVLRLVELDEQH